MSHGEAVETFVVATTPPGEVAPLVAAVRGLAALLDADDSDPGIWREYRFMLRELREAVGSGVGDDLEAEFAALDGGSDLRDSEESGTAH